MPDPALMPGSFVAGRYRMLRALGRGGTGAVYLAEHVRAARWVAIKVLSRPWASIPAARERFLAERATVNRIAHPNVVEVLDAGELPDGSPYLVLEYVDGVPLLHAIARCGRFDAMRACRVARDVGRALGAAHDVGVVHRDLTSRNVMLEPGAAGERAMLLDFGIACDVLEAHDVRFGVIAGTPEYMAPEQARGLPATPSVDVYALGVLMFEMVTGSLPFTGPVPLALLVDKTLDAAPSVATRRSDLPARLVELVDACLATEASARPENMTEVVERLDAIGVELAGCAGRRAS